MTAEFSTSHRRVEEALRNVSEMMRASGFAVNVDVQVRVDEKLPFMGYTSQAWKRHLIVVSGFALRSGMLEGLLTHEMSHIYRSVTNHPSHDQEIISGIVGSFSNRHKLTDHYHHEILHQMVNHIEDLYADDISIKVFIANRERFPAVSRLSNFFLSWIKDEPVKSGGEQEDKWINAAILLRNCFAISNMERHGIEDVGYRAKSGNEQFLSRISSGAVRKYGYFHRFMVSLKEDVTEKEFREQLDEYLEQFLRVVKSI